MPFSFKDRNILVTGGAGFIGSNMVKSLIAENMVTVLDNFSAVDDRFLKPLAGKNLKVIKGDITKQETFRKLQQFDMIFHLAANSDVKHGSSDPMIDVNTNDTGTVNVLEFMRRSDSREIGFSSSSTVYGETDVLPTPETYGPYRPISSYGASKAAGEGYIFAYSHYYGLRGSIYRFANVVGTNSTHGVIFDFIHKLKKDPKNLEILGDGTQRKSYIHVDDCVNSMLYIHGLNRPTDVYNLGNTGTTGVLFIADRVCQKMGLKGVRYNFVPSKGGRGWPGDVKLAHLSIDKITSLGWKNRYSSDQAVEISIDETLKTIT